MTVYTWPTDLVPFSSYFYKQHHSAVFESPLTRTQQILARPGDRYLCEASFLVNRVKAGRIDALLAQIKGPQNTVEIWPFNKPAPLGDDWDTAPTSYLTATDFTDGTDFTDTTGFIYSRTYGPFVISKSPLMLGGFAANAETLKPGNFLIINGTFLMVLSSADAGPDGEVGLSVDGSFSASYGDEPTLDHPRIEMRITSDDAGMNIRSMQSGDGFVVPYTIQFVEVLT